MNGKEKGVGSGRESFPGRGLRHFLRGAPGMPSLEEAQTKKSPRGCPPWAGRRRVELLIQVLRFADGAELFHYAE